MNPYQAHVLLDAMRNPSWWLLVAAETDTYSIMFTRRKGRWCFYSTLGNDRMPLIADVSPEEMCRFLL